MSEVVASVAMLAVTMAVLGGLGVLSMTSIHTADGALLSGSQSAASSAGLLLTVVSTQTNSSGAYVWFFDYGWTSARVSSVYLDGGVLSGWSTTCSPIQVKEMCVVVMPPATHGEVSVLFGSRSIGLTL